MSGRTCSGKTFSAGAGAVAGQEPAAKKDEPGQVEDPQQEVKEHGEGGGGQAQGNSGGSAGVSQAQLEFINIALGSGKDQEEGRSAAKKDDLGQVEDQQQEVKGHGKGGGGEGGQAQGGSGSGGISQARLEFIKMAMPDFAP